MFKTRKDAMSYGYYYIYFEADDQTALDSEVAEALNMSIEDYRNKMMHEFNGFVSKTKSHINFKNQIDAENAVKFINSQV